MRVLIIGGNGFIGQVLISQLRKKNCEIVNIYRNSQDTLQEHVENIHLNRKDVPAFRRRLHRKKFDAVIDLAAFTKKDVEVVDEIVDSDVYVFISSCAVYGEIDSCNINEKTTVTANKHHKYAYNKIAAEDRVRQKPHIIIRPAVVYGKNDSHRERGQYFFQHIHESKITIPGKSTVQNNYIYVDDLARLIAMMLFSTKRNVTVNAAGMSFDWDVYLQTLAEVCKVPQPKIESLGLSLPEFRTYAKNNKLHFPHNAFHDFVLNCDLAQELYGWQPTTSLHEGLERSRDWASI